MSADPLAMLLRSFKLPTMAARYPEILTSAETNNWGYRKFLTQLCESEAADRKERKRDRLLKESGLPAGKTFGTLDENKLPLRIRRLLPTLLEGGWVERAENLLAFGLPSPPTHYSSAVSRCS
jgi:DNA replication protein DnaC